MDRSGPEPDRAVESATLRTAPVLCLCLLAACGLTSARDAPLNYFEWIAVAPTVVVGESLDNDGKYAEVRVSHVLRGDDEPGSVIRIRVRSANRDRDRILHKKGAKVKEGESFILLLQRAPTKKGPAAYELIRGIDGIRPLPAEGSEALLQALATFVEIQDAKDHQLTWARLREMLEETDTILIDVALEQYLKFRRGDTALLPTVRPLLDHPEPELREQATRLIEQILQRYGGDEVADLGRLKDEIAARARRDAAPSVRIAAIQALGRFEGDTVLTILDEIADDDPDQQVRYFAEALAYERRSAAAPGSD
jgi:hypothetical protein